LTLTDNKGQKALQDEDPPPAGQSCSPTHLKNASGKKTTKSTSSGGSREEDGHAQTTLMTPIPHCNVVCDTGEETALSNAESSTADHQASVVLGHTKESGADGPGNHNARDPDRGAEPLHGHVAGDLSSNIKGEEDGQRIIVLQLDLAEAKVSLQSVEANWRSCQLLLL
jgi:hypothetical protein